MFAAFQRILKRKKKAPVEPELAETTPLLPEEAEKSYAPPPAVVEKFRGQPFELGLIDDPSVLKGVLQRYDAMYWIFNNENAAYPTKTFSSAVQAARFLQQPYPPQGRVPREQILEIGCIDWCVAHAFGETGDAIGKYTGSINNSILVSALLLNVTAQVFLNPPTFDSEIFNIIVLALLGISSFVQLFCLVAYIAVANMINQPYVPSLTMYARIEADVYIGFLTVCMYLGILCFMGSLFFVAYVGNFIDFLIMLPAFMLLFVFIYMWVSTIRISTELRRETSWQFYEMYCEDDGKIKQRYMDLIYGAWDETEKGLVEAEASLMMGGKTIASPPVSPPQSPRVNFREEMKEPFPVQRK